VVLRTALESHLSSFTLPEDTGIQMPQAVQTEAPDLGRVLLGAALNAGTDEGHRKAHRCRNSTSFSTTDQLCGMRLLSPTRKLWVLPGAAHLSASPSNRSLLPPSSTTFFAILFRRSQFPRARCHVSCPAAQSRHGLTSLLPALNLHRSESTAITCGHVQTALPDAPRTLHTRSLLSENAHPVKR
jgi:hypothetical protein